MVRRAAVPIALIMVSALPSRIQRFTSAMISGTGIWAVAPSAAVSTAAALRSGATTNEVRSPGAMHFDSQVVDVRMILRQSADHFPDPEADLEAPRRAARENRLQIQSAVLEVQAIERP